MSPEFYCAIELWLTVANNRPFIRFVHKLARDERILAADYFPGHPFSAWPVADTQASVVGVVGLLQKYEQSETNGLAVGRQLPQNSCASA